MDETFTPDVLKQAVKEAVVASLNENRDLFREIVAEALEDFALAEAIKGGEETDEVSRDRIFEILEKDQ